MASIYESIKQIYAELSNDKGSVDKVREILESLRRRGVDRKFVEDCFKILAVEKMTLVLLDEMKGKKL